MDESKIWNLMAKKLAAANDHPDLLIGNNVLAHVPDIVDFVRGLKVLLKDGIPFWAAASAVFLAGSMPMTGIFFCI